VELEGDTGMSLVYEDLASGQKESAEERAVVMYLGQDEMRVGQSEKETVNTELEKSACEVSVSERDSVEVHSIKPTITSSSLQAMFVSTLPSLKSDQLEMLPTLKESFKSEISALQSKVKGDVRLENQKLIKKFESEIKKLRQEFTEKLSSESDKFRMTRNRNF
jgi:hypothetical protein